MLWKRNKDIVTVGHQIVDKNVRLEETKNGNSLVVGPASPDDEAVRKKNIIRVKLMGQQL